MKKYILYFVFSLLLLSAPSIHIKAENKIDNKLLRDSLITTLNPYINQEIVNHYGYSKQYGLYNVEILNLNRIQGGYAFKIKLQVHTFEHAHNPPYGTETMTFEINPSGVKTIDFTHVGDDDEKQIAAYYKKAIDDLIQIFHLDLTTYDQYSYSQLNYLSYTKQGTFKSLFDIVLKIQKNILNTQIHPPYKNVISPVTFIKGTDGYIVFKMSDGTNVVYKIEQVNDHWVIIDQQKKQGTKMKNELIWYM